MCAKTRSIWKVKMWKNFSPSLDLVSIFGSMSARLAAELQFPIYFLILFFSFTSWVFSVELSRSGVAQNGFTKLEMCFSRAELNSRLREVQSAIARLNESLDTRVCCDTDGRFNCYKFCLGKVCFMGETFDCFWSWYLRLSGQAWLSFFQLGLPFS